MSDNRTGHDPMPQPKPTLGRIVHCKQSREEYAGIITKVWPDSLVSITAFTPNSGAMMLFRVRQMSDADYETCQFGWRWPPREEAQVARRRVGADGLTEAQAMAGHIALPAMTEVSLVKTPAVLGSTGMRPMSLQEGEEAAAAVAVAPRVSMKDIEAAIAAEYSFTAREAVAGLDANRKPTNLGLLQLVDLDQTLSVLTICILVMKNGFKVVGTSSPSDSGNFDADLGRKFAREDAVRQLWPLMGFDLRSRLAAEAGAQ